MKRVEDSDEHLRYEVWMLQDTLQRLLRDDDLQHDAVMKNAAVESCVVHARSLAAFIYAENPKPDDITSDHYVVDKATWALARGTRPPILETLRVRANKEVAHLTTKRLVSDDPAQRWPLEEIVDALHVVLKRFVTYARLDPEVARFIADLRRPREIPTMTVYNPGSTAVLRAIKVVNVAGGGVDVGTILPPPGAVT